jgi:hypothetical protein
MQFANKLAHVLRKTHAFRIGHTLLPKPVPARNLTGDLERQMYGMSAHDELLLRQILAMAGDAVHVEQDTFGIDQKNNPHYLRRGQEVMVAKTPLTFDPQGEAHVSILDEDGIILSMRLSDFVHDIQANR